MHLVFRGLIPLPWEENSTLKIRDVYGNPIYIPTTTVFSLAFSLFSMIKAIIYFNIARIHVSVCITFLCLNDLIYLWVVNRQQFLICVKLYYINTKKDIVSRERMWHFLVSTFDHLALFVSTAIFRTATIVILSVYLPWGIAIGGPAFFLTNLMCGYQRYE